MKRVLASFLLLTSCGIFAPPEQPRVSTAAERATAIGYLTTASTALEAARIGAWIDEKAYAAGVDAIVALRKRVDASETVPTTWQIVLDDVLTISLRWVPVKD